jgi:mono/diheme cytochrome c family protein
MRFVRDAVITVLVLAVVIGIAAYARVRAGGLSADAEPGSIERSIASRLVRLSIPADHDRATNPFAADRDTWRAAVDHYSDHCAICHGDDGHGRTDLGQNMYPKVPDLADAAVQQLSDGAIFSIIQNGVRWTGMPAWKHEHTADDTWKLVSLVRRLPSLSQDELEGLTHREDDRQSEPPHDRDGSEHHQHNHTEHQHPGR